MSVNDKTVKPYLRHLTGAIQYAALLARNEGAHAATRTTDGCENTPATPDAPRTGGPEGPTLFPARRASRAILLAVMPHEGQRRFEIQTTAMRPELRRGVL